MLRVTLRLWCHAYHIPPHARVGIFPLHLDPPTLQHRELFRLLLGGTPEPVDGYCTPGCSSSSSSSNNPGQVSPKFWYMKDIADSIQHDSQLTPFDDLILVPNTRYSISLRHSTHLATLAVLGTRGMPHVHVDFTALENPDDSLPVVKELTERYPNAVLVHWLHDAYEMQHWRNFCAIKMRVPLLLLQTNSIPANQLTRPPGLALADVPGMHTRQYPPPNAQLLPGRAPHDPKNGESELHRSIGRDPGVAARTTGDWAQTFRSRWWQHSGGRGDDLVEVSRSYINSASSSWLGGPTFTPLASLLHDAAQRRPSPRPRPSTGSVVVGLDGTVQIVSTEGPLPGSSSASVGTHTHDADDHQTTSVMAVGEVASDRAILSELQDVRTELDAMVRAFDFKNKSGDAEPRGSGHGAASPELAAAVTASTGLVSSLIGSDAVEAETMVPFKSRIATYTPATAPYAGRSVRVLLEELYPNSTASPVTVTAADATGDGDVTTGTMTQGKTAEAARRSCASPHFGEAKDSEEKRHRINREPPQVAGADTIPTSPDCTTTAPGRGIWGESDLLDAIPLVEVLPVSRTTGADTRQALWEQQLSPTHLLSDSVLRYVESHGLYRDSRKNAAIAGGSTRFVAVRPAVPIFDGGAPHSSYYYGRDTDSTATSSDEGGNNGVGALHRMTTQRESAAMTFPGIMPRLELHHDKNNLLACEQYSKLKVFQCRDGEVPDLIVPIGGDGYMMHCIRNNWRRFVPFYGVNAGHVGYLLNDCTTLDELFTSPLKLHTANMLYCQAERETETGERVLLSELAFNDAWVERSSGQTALIRISVNGDERIRRLRGDGVLVSTAAGSTAYSQALGASPVPVGVPLIQVVGSNVVSPAQWRPAHMDQEDQVELEVIDSVKRPCRCFVDSVNMGNVVRMLVRSSRVAGVTLAFSRSCDLHHKLYQMQFPKTL